MSLRRERRNRWCIPLPPHDIPPPYIYCPPFVIAWPPRGESAKCAIIDKQHGVCGRAHLMASLVPGIPAGVHDRRVQADSRLSSTFVKPAVKPIVFATYDSRSRIPASPSSKDSSFLAGTVVITRDVVSCPEGRPPESDSSPPLRSVARP